MDRRAAAQWDRHKHLYFTIYFTSQLLRTRHIIPLSLLSQITLTSWVAGLTIMPPKRSRLWSRYKNVNSVINSHSAPALAAGYHRVQSPQLSLTPRGSPEILLWCLSPSSKSPHWSHLALLWQVTSGWPPGTWNIQDYQFQIHNNKFI